MRSIKLFVTAAVMATLSYGEMVNVNPDPNGEPWIAGGVPPMTTEGEAKMAALPRFHASVRSSRNLPKSVDNANKYLRPIFNQEGNSCAQASGVGYIYTYEVARLLDRDASLEENWFPSHFTWHFINEGKNYGSWPYQGWDILEKVGCPSYTDFGGMNGGDPSWTKWMSGYEKYQKGMRYRVAKQGIIENLDTEEGLNNLKAFLYDYGRGEAVGGLVSFSALSSGAISKKVSGGEFDGEMAITKWGTGGAHMMTFVGYNDEIQCDINGDGQFTNHIDINNDGKVDMKDWEIGALKVANSWGDGWGNNGFGWMMYSVIGYGLDDKYNAQNNGGIYRNLVYYVEADTSHKEKQGLKLRMVYDDRWDLTMVVGVAQDTTATTPDFIDTIPIGMPSAAGGAKTPMLGKGDNNTIELGLDISDVVEKINGSDNYKVFLTLTSNSKEGTGALKQLGLIDHSDNDKSYFWRGSDGSLSNISEKTFSLVKNGTGVSHEMNPPELLSVINNKALTGEDMNLIITLQEESELTSVEGTYTLEGVEKRVFFEKKSSEGSTKVYQGAIPKAEVPTEGSLIITATDAYNNSETSLPYTIMWADNFTMHYDTEISTGYGLGASGGDSYIPLIKLSEDELSAFYGKSKLSMIQIYIKDKVEKAEYMDSVVVKVYRSKGMTPSEEIYSENITTDLLYSSWNYHYLKKPITVEEGYSYWIGYSIDFRYGWFCSFDESAPIEGKSNVIGYKDEWKSLSDFDWGVNGRWNIQALIESEVAVEKPKLIDLFGTEAHRDSAMNITIQTLDNKGVTSAVATYSLANGITADVVLTKENSRNELARFVGTLPSPKRSITGTMQIKLTDSDGNKLTSKEKNICWLTDKEIHFDGDYERNVGNPSGDHFAPTIRLTASDFTKEASAEVISGVKFYLNVASESDKGEVTSLKVKIFRSSSSASEPEEEIYSYEMKDEIILKGWQNHILAQPIAIESNYDYWIQYDIDFNSGYFCGISKHADEAYMKNGGLIYWREKWTGLDEWSFTDSRWNLRALVEKSPQEVSIVKESTKELDFSLNSIGVLGNRLTFDITLPQAEAVSLAVYNLKGQVIRSVKMNTLSKGANKLQLNKTSFASGIYLYHIQAGDKIAKGKMAIQ